MLLERSFYSYYHDYMSKNLQGKAKNEDYGKFYDEGIKKGFSNAQASLYAHDLLAKKYNFKNPFTIKQK
tara:strand:+ start:459 stop:665 length:207 start_codon:yes stop_codon:yes gene_type:complete